jgi:hypothetical protein
MFVRIRKDQDKFEFSTHDGINIDNETTYPARYINEDELQIYINGEYHSVEGIDFDFIDNVKIDMLSPDGFSIHHSDVYDTPEEALAALDEWKKRFERQGYYSSNQGRIGLDEIKDYCRMKVMEFEPEEN